MREAHRNGRADPWDFRDWLKDCGAALRAAESDGMSPLQSQLGAELRGFQQTAMEARSGSGPFDVADAMADCRALLADPSAEDSFALEMGREVATATATAMEGRGGGEPFDVDAAMRESRVLLAG